MNNTFYLSNFTLSGGYRTDIGLTAAMPYGCGANFYNCNIYDCSCVLSANQSSRADFFHGALAVGCDISGLVWDAAYIAYGGGSRGSQFISCTIHDNKQTKYGGGIFMHAGYGSNHHNVFYNNICLGQGFYGAYHCNILYDNTFNGLISNGDKWCNSLFYRNKLSGDFGKAILKNNIFLDNSFRNNRFRSTSFTPTSADWRVMINNVFNMPSSYFDQLNNQITASGVEGLYTTISGNIFNCTNPGFVDLENLDFRLLESSPCVSAGTVDTNYRTARNWADFPWATSRDMDGRLYKRPNPSAGPLSVL